MIINIIQNEISYSCDLNRPLDISIPLGRVKCFNAPDPIISPLQSGNFIGAVKAGAPVNFFNVAFNPHGNGTHTECLGHITEKQESINQHLKQYHFFALLISVDLQKKLNGDLVITKKSLQNLLDIHSADAIVIRTLPNKKEKLSMDYSNSNPPYFEEEAMEFLVQKKIKHLLIDLPSVDKEVDEGILKSHHIFWNIQGKTQIDSSRSDCTITELIYVPNFITDGLYLLNLQIPSLELDAAPSKPVLFKLYTTTTKI